MRPRAAPAPLCASTPLCDLPGIGPTKAAALAEHGLRTLLDAFETPPAAWDDLRATVTTHDLWERHRAAEAVGRELPRVRVAVRARVVCEPVRIQLSPKPDHTMLVVEAQCDAGGKLSALFFAGLRTEMSRVCRTGSTHVFIGVPELKRGAWQMRTPRVLGEGEALPGIVPRYPAVSYGPANAKKKIDLAPIARLACDVVRDVSEPVPADVRARLGFMARGDALRALHQATEGA